MRDVKFAELLAEACAIYDRRPLEHAAIEFYWRLLKHYELDVLRDALERHVRTSQWFPKPAEIIKLVEGTQADQSAAAWANILSEMKRGGSWRLPIFANPDIMPAIRDVAGNWINLCGMSITQLDFMRPKFERAYNARANPPELTGPDRLALEHDDDDDDEED